jgi:hypothetical protein
VKRVFTEANEGLLAANQASTGEMLAFMHSHGYRARPIGSGHRAPDAPHPGESLLLFEREGQFRQE